METSPSSKPLFEIKVRSRETKHEARIELRDGSSFVCEYKVLAVLERGEPRRKINELVIVTDKGRFDIHEITGLPKDFPIFISTNEKRHLVIDKNIPKEILVGEPTSMFEIAIILHEIGHYNQYKDDDFLKELIVDENEEKFDKAKEMVKENQFALFFYNQWSVIREVLKALPLKNIRPKFHQAFQTFLHQFEDMDNLCEQFCELEKQRMKLTDDSQKTFDETGVFDEEEFEIADQKLLRLQEEIKKLFPFDELVFFLSESTMVLENDATQRALTWLKEIGEKAELPMLKEEGGEFLFESLTTYSSGCVSVEKK